jgi:hypothetical protein
MNEKYIYATDVMAKKYREYLNTHIKGIAILYMADLIAIRLEESKEYVIIKHKSLPPNCLIEYKMFKKALHGCQCPIVLSGRYLGIKRDTKRIVNAVASMMESKKENEDD